MKRGRGPRFPSLLGGAALFLTLQVQGAEWVHFTPCGFQIPSTEIVDRQLARSAVTGTQVAPSYTGFAARREAVVGLVGFKRPTVAGGPACTMVVLVGGRHRLVIGTLEEIIEKLEN